jgi:hypothetical protein
MSSVAAQAVLPDFQVHRDWASGLFVSFMCVEETVYRVVQITESGMGQELLKEFSVWEDLRGQVS